MALTQVQAGMTVSPTLMTINGGAASPLASGTTVDFTSIPSWVKKITIMFNEVSQNSASQTMIVQIGSTTFTTSGYKSGICYAGAGTLIGANPTAGFGVASQLSNAAMMSGIMTITTLGSNIWVASFAGGTSDAAYAYVGGGSLSLGATLDRVRITTVGGTATFDAGNINVLYEG
jgi:hypothetical protein